MGMAALLESEWTAERWRALPEDGRRYEVLDGELYVSPAPTPPHQRVVEELFLLLRPWSKSERVARVGMSPADIEFSKHRVLQPDLYAIPMRTRPPREWSESRDLILAVEVLSPGSARADRHRKRLIYQSEQVAEYWVVDPDARLVERWRPDDHRPEILSDTLSWTPVSNGPTLSLDLPALFRAALDES